MVVSPQTDCAGGGVVCEVTPTGPASPPAPLRMARGVVCEVTPIRLLNIWRTYRGISVITPLSIRRGAGGEASVLIPCHVLTLCYSQNLFICYPVFLIPSVHRPSSPVSLPALNFLIENIEHLTGLLLTLHAITKDMTIRLICMSFRV